MAPVKGPGLVCCASAEKIRDGEEEGEREVGRERGKERESIP